MPPPGPRWVICGHLRPYSETEGAASTPRSHLYPTPSPPNIRCDPERSECIPHSERTPSPQRCPFWQRGSTGSARSGERGREARTRLASSPPQSTAGTAARHGCRAHSTAGPPSGLFERPSAIPGPVELRPMRRVKRRRADVYGPICCRHMLACLFALLMARYHDQSV